MLILFHYFKTTKPTNAMLHWKAVYIILAIVFGVIGFIGIGDGGLQPAKYISGIFVLLLIVFWATDLVGKKKRD